MCIRDSQRTPWSSRDVLGALQSSAERSGDPWRALRHSRELQRPPRLARAQKVFRERGFGLDATVTGP
eukprot:14849156-Alexandrium_andersonii.AAC.1